MNKEDIDYSLYLVTDRRNKTTEEFLKIIEESIQGGVTVVQLREKDTPTKEFYQIAIKLKEITQKYKIPLIINDRIDIALAIECEGVHLGQDDMPAEIARKILGKDKLIGVSAHNIEEAKKAVLDGADYIGSGAVFPTSTKNDASDVPIEKLKDITNSINIPTVAIGGIKSENIKQLENTNISGISVVSAIMESENPIKASEKLKSIYNSIEL
ncbi:MAG: thiamine phosphate synthase [archaeon]|nr:thiamine phosphate synthase [archaeon]